MVGYIYLITDTTNGMKYTGKHHYDKPELDPNYHGSGRIIKNIYKTRPETLKEEYIKTCYSEDGMSNDEKHYIKVFNTLYPNGYNLTEGGDGGVPSDETRKKISKSLIGENHPLFGKHLKDETRKKISESNKGKHRSDETRKKISETKKGKHHSEESRKKMSEAKKLISEESRRKMSEAHKGRTPPNKGKPMSEEARKKMSEAAKGRTSPNKGKHLSEETRKKMSEAAKRRFNKQKNQQDECVPLW